MQSCPPTCNVGVVVLHDVFCHQGGQLRLIPAAGDRQLKGAKAHKRPRYTAHHSTWLVLGIAAVW